MEKVSLGDYIEQIRGISYKPNEISDKPLEDYLPVLRATNFDESGFKLSELNYIHKSRIKKEQLIQAGDILIAASSGSKDIVGKNIQFKESLNGSFGAFCKLVRVKRDFNKDFIAHFFKTPYYRNIIRNSIQGANINNLKNEHINDLIIAKPPIEHQIHIANILSKAEALIRERKESLRLLDEFLKSTFLEMFGPSNRDFERWSVIKIADLAEQNKGSMRTGPFGSDLLHSEFISDGVVRVLGIDNVVNNRFEWNSIRSISLKKFEQLKRYQVFPNDVLISIMATNGRTAVVPENIPICINSKHLAAITPDRSKVDPRFLSFSFHSDPLILKQLSNQTRGAIMGGLNLTIIKGLKLKLPPLKLQTKFAHIVEKTEALKVHYQSSLQELENLYGSLSQRAFRGELKVKGEESSYVKTEEDKLRMAAEDTSPYQKL